MNSIETQQFNILRQTRAMRDQLMDILSDADLNFALPNNRTLGSLCVESGQVQASYIDSFKTFKHNWHYAPAPAGVEGSVAGLKAWFKALDSELEGVLSSMSEAQIQSGMIDRGFPLPVAFHVQVYRESLIIFLAKTVVYLNAMGRPLPKQMAEWIG